MNYINFGVLCFCFCFCACLFVVWHTTFKCMYLCKTSHLKNVTNKSYHFFPISLSISAPRLWKCWSENEFSFLFPFVVFSVHFFKSKNIPQKCAESVCCAPFLNVKSFYYTHWSHNCAWVWERVERGEAHIIFMKTEHLLKRKTLAKYYIHLICIVLLHIHLHTHSIIAYNSIASI